jgi:hypothetical protein
MERERVSRVGTARALVLLGSALQLAASGVLTLSSSLARWRSASLVLVFGPVLLDRADTPVLAVVVFVAVSLLTIALANVVALRSSTIRTVAIGGCGTLLAGSVLGAGALLVLITLR